MESPPDEDIAAESFADEEVLPVWDAKVLHIYISKGHDFWGKHGEGRLQHGISEVSEVECMAGMGLLGDRYFGHRPDYKGQITFFDESIVRDVREHFKLPKLPASVFRRNVIVDGVNLKAWLGKRFRFQGIDFEGSQECKPCHWMDRVIGPGGEEFLKGGCRGGLRAKILTSGTLRVG